MEHFIKRLNLFIIILLTIFILMILVLVMIKSPIEPPFETGLEETNKDIETGMLDEIVTLTTQENESPDSTSQPGKIEQPTPIKNISIVTNQVDSASIKPKLSISPYLTIINISSVTAETCSYWIQNVDNSIKKAKVDLKDLKSVWNDYKNDLVESELFYNTALQNQVESDIKKYRDVVGNDRDRITKSENKITEQEKYINKAEYTAQQLKIHCASI